MRRGMKKCMLRPCAGRRVKDPATYKVLSEAGEEKELSSYWLRRLRDGDVECVEDAELKEIRDVDFV